MKADLSYGDMTRTTAIYAVLILPLLLILAGCTSGWKRPPSVKPHTQRLVLTHHTEGSQGPLLVRDDVWYQLAGVELLVLDPRGRLISTIELADPGMAGQALDMEVVGDTMYVLLDDQEVVHLSLEEPMRPWVVDRVSADSLGLSPIGLDMLDGKVVAHGPEGVRTLDARRVIHDQGDSVLGVAQQGGRTLYIVGRRIHRRADDQYVGSASILEPFRLEDGPDGGVMLFARVEDTGSLVGIMGEDCREVDARLWTRAVPGRVQSLHGRGDSMLVATDEAVHVFEATRRGLIPVWSWDAQGVRDADWLDDDTVVVSGEFGRGVMDVVMPGDPPRVASLHEVPGGLDAASSSGAAIMASRDSQWWRYPVGQSPERVETDVVLSPPRRNAAVLGWSVVIEDDGRATLTSPEGMESITAPGDGRFVCAAATEDAFWLGHDSGIVAVMLPRDSATEAIQLGIQIAGPVLCIEPLMLGGGVAFASKDGGFGVVREVH